MGDATENSSNSQTPRGLNFEALKAHIIAHKIDCGLWAIRVLLILFSIGYFIPIFG